MSNPVLDDEEKPLDPAAQRLEVRVRRLILIAGLTLAVGLFAVFGAILYRVMATGDSPRATAPAAGTFVADAEAEAAVRTALANWNAAFNAADTGKVCDLFAPDLRADYAGLPERNFDDMCSHLKQVLADRSRLMAYALDIREVIVSGDIAIVRLVWTLTNRPQQGEAVTTTETGMDLFRRQPDGSWKISRFIAF